METSFRLLNTFQTKKYENTCFETKKTAVQDSFQSAIG